MSNGSEAARFRQRLLDAIPIPAACISLIDDHPAIAGVNAHFEGLAAACDSPLQLGDIAQWLAAFIASDMATGQYEWRDYGQGERLFSAHLSRIDPVGSARPHFLLLLMECAAQLESEHNLRREMLCDQLTGLPNRQAFNERIDEAYQANGDKSDRYAVLSVDLRRFSLINESLDSTIGDELIVAVSHRILGTLRSHDLLARVGGDEFGILVRLIDGPGDALHAARRIQASLTQPIALCELEIRVDCAIGCSLVDDSANVSGDIVRNAQFAMKRSKRSGKIEVYQPGDANASRQRFSLEAELRRAIERDELSLSYQPLIDLQTNRLSGFEALARWTHPVLGAVPPVQFIPVAEECGLIVPLGRWVLDSAARTLAEWDRRAGQVLPIYIGINVSAVQLQRDNLTSAASETLLTHGLTGHRLTFELTESAIVSDPERASRALMGLKALDARIAMDDFGTGHSSLAYLQKLPIDILKVDRSFVTGMLADRDSLAIVRAVLSLAEALGMKTTAEGIETAELAQTLAALGCSTGQGFYFARPLGPDDAFDYLMARNA